MKLRLSLSLLIAATLVVPALSAAAPAARQDALWARRTTAPIVMDGVLNEAAWASAESVLVRYGYDTGFPGSGWKIEAGFNPTDSTRTVLKFLVKDNTLWLGARFRDKSVGGSKLFNRFDGMLMALKDHLDAGAPKPPVEYFYAWWSGDNGIDPQAPGQPPYFIGRYGALALPDTTRAPASISAWDARTVVNGLSNSDAVADNGYTVEMRFDLGILGYDVTKAAGDIVEWNIGLYDCDCFWPLAASCAGGANFASNRVWFQSPWGNAYWFDEVHIFARPDITTSSGALPVIQPEYFVPEVPGPAPTIDGNLNEAVWNTVLTKFDLKWNDATLRATYPGVGPSRSGQYQPPVNGGTASVLDPSTAHVKMFIKDDFLYLGFDVDDQLVQSHPDPNRWDGFMVTVTDRSVRDNDNQFKTWQCSFQVGPTGAIDPQEYLLTLIQAGKAQAAMTLKAGTVVDTLGPENGVDTGYRAEIAMDLKEFGYPAGLGDQVLLIGVNFYDGDSFGSNYTSSYATHTWWFRQSKGQCCPVWAHIIQTTTSDVPDMAGRPPVGYELLGAFPNPAVRSTIRYALPEMGQVRLELFDISGRVVLHQALGRLDRGWHDASVVSEDLANGLYLYRIVVTDSETGAVKATLPGRLSVVH